MSTAISLDTSQALEVIPGQIGFDQGKLIVSDVDFYKITMPLDGALFIDIDTPFSGSVDSLLRFYDANGALLKANDHALSTNRHDMPTEYVDARYPARVFEHKTNRDSYTGHVSDSFILADGLEEGETYYIAVSGRGNDSFSPESFVNRKEGSKGRYNLSFDFVTSDINGRIQDAESLSKDVVEEEFIIKDWDGEWLDVGANDIDFFQLSPTESGFVDLQVKSFAVADNNDTVDGIVTFFDSAELKLVSEIETWLHCDQKR